MSSDLSHTFCWQKYIFGCLDSNPVKVPSNEALGRQWRFNQQRKVTFHLWRNATVRRIDRQVLHQKTLCLNC